LGKKFLAEKLGQALPVVLYWLPAREIEGLGDMWN